jgi:hypothetical protein
MLLLGLGIHFVKAGGDGPNCSAAAAAHVFFDFKSWPTY